MGELPALGRIKWKASARQSRSWVVWSFLAQGPCLPENYMPPGGISKGLVLCSVCIWHLQLLTLRVRMCKILCLARRVERQVCAKV